MVERPKYYDRDWGYKYVKNVDVSEIKELCLNLTEEDWLENTIRQQIAKPHGETESIRLFIPYKPTPPEWAKRLYGSDILAETVKKVSEEIASELDSVFIKGTIVRLRAGKSVKTHQDGCPTVFFAKRIHIPIIPAGVNTYNGEDKEYIEGECWEVNNLVPHSATNNTEIDRILLMIDVLPKSQETFLLENVKDLFRENGENNFV